MKFLKSWTVDTEKIPAYASFKTDFTLDIDYPLLESIANSDNSNITNDRKKLLLPVLNAIDKKTNTLKVSHNNRFSLGRFYPNNSISPICVSRHIKHTLFHYLDWVDLDMVKGHPSILYSIAKNNGVTLPAFEKYLSNPKQILDEMVEFYSADEPLTHDDVKGIFNVKIYGGNHNTWIAEMGKENKEVGTTAIHPFEKVFAKECETLINLVYLGNKNITDKIKGDCNDEYKLKNKTMSYFCGTIENELLFIAYKFLTKKGVIQEKKCALEYDGLCFKNPNINMDEIINELNWKIKTDTKLDVKFIIKTYNPLYIHQDIIDKRNELLPVAIALPIESQSIETQEEDAMKVYYDWKEKFERHHFKVINKSFFIKCIKDKNGIILEFRIFSKKEIIDSYEHDYFKIVNKKTGESTKTPCVKHWLLDSSMRHYEDVGIFPPPLSCPTNIYNLWTPFYIQSLNDVYVWENEYVCMDKKEELLQKCEALIHHIKILCNHNESDFLYLQRWIGQMLKFPALKTTCITLISEEGAGKGTLLYLLEKIMGSVKVMETTEPDKHVWGNFNGAMKDCFLVNCNELDMKAQQEAEGKIKGLITDTSLWINEKGIKAFKINGYHRYLFTSNKEVPLKTHSKDRRNKIIRSSDEKCNDKTYFTALRSYIDDEKVLLMLYEYFINLPNLDTFHTELIEQNEYQKAIAESFSMSVPELFLEHLTRENYTKEKFSYYGEELLQEFTVFKNGRKFNYECDCIKLCRNIKLLKLPENTLTSKRTNKGVVTTYDVKKLIQHFKLEDMEIVEEENYIEEENF